TNCTSNHSTNWTSYSATIRLTDFISIHLTICESCCASFISTNDVAFNYANLTTNRATHYGSYNSTYSCSHNSTNCTSNHSTNWTSYSATIRLTDFISIHLTICESCCASFISTNDVAFNYANL